MRPRAQISRRSFTRASIARSIEWFADLPSGTRVALADIPLLFETGHEHDFERVVVCACDPGEQLRRLMSTGSPRPEEAGARIAAQWPIAEKIRRADYVIMTDWTFSETEAQVRKVFEVAVGAGVRRVSS